MPDLPFLVSSVPDLPADQDQVKVTVYLRRPADTPDPASFLPLVQALADLLTVAKANSWAEAYSETDILDRTITDSDNESSFADGNAFLAWWEQHKNDPDPFNNPSSPAPEAPAPAPEAPAPVDPPIDTSAPA